MWQHPTPSFSNSLAGNEDDFLSPCTYLILGSNSELGVGSGREAITCYISRGR